MLCHVRPILSGGWLTCYATISEDPASTKRLQGTPADRDPSHGHPYPKVAKTEGEVLSVLRRKDQDTLSDPHNPWPVDESVHAPSRLRRIRRASRPSEHDLAHLDRGGALFPRDVVVEQHPLRPVVPFQRHVH